MATLWEKRIPFLFESNKAGDRASAKYSSTHVGMMMDVVGGGEEEDGGGGPHL